jgi:DNA-binding MarR family transcriptional regulator
LEYCDDVTKDTKATVAGEVWKSFLGYFWATRDDHFKVLAQLGLTPGHMKTLFILDPGEPASMGELAELLVCDASNVTWLVDRLEDRGLVERHPHPRDRRVKTVLLTPEGVKAKADLIERLGDPPPDLLTLDRADLETLRDALALLPPHPAFGAATGAARPSRAS